MPAHIVGYPDQTDWLTHVTARDNQEERKILDANRESALSEKQDVTNRRNAEPKHAEAIAMLQLVSSNGYGDCKHCSHDEDWDSPHLSRLCFEAQLCNDCRYKEGAGIASVHNAHVLEYSNPDLPVFERALPGSFVQMVHPSQALVGLQTGDKKGAFFVVEEFGGLWPVGNKDFRGSCYDACDQSFDDELQYC